MSRQQDLEDALKNMTDLTVSPGMDITTSNIKKSNVEGYYHALKAMGLATDLNSSSSIENVLKVWVDNKSIIQECKSISFEGKFITEFPYDALNEMSSLVELNISNNTELTIDPKKFKILKAKLISIGFSSCRMSPATFDAIFNCECLEKLNLSNTPFKKIFRTNNYSWGNLKDTLIELNISRINMTIRTLNIIAELKSLRILHVSKNNLGDISNWLGFKHLPNLTELNISSNPLTSIPDSINNLLNLTRLNLSSNRLASIPDSIGDLSNLTKLDLSWNRLTTIPKSIGDLLKLTGLDLSVNPLTSIPESIGDLKNLKNLGLYSNELVSIPDRIGDLKNLTELKLSWNKLTSIPESIGNLSNLTELYLSENRLTSIPESIGDLSNLTELSLSHNQLTSIPDRIGDLSKLTRLDLSVNPLTRIPESIGDLKNLTELKLSWNKLTSIPESIGDLSNLTELDLSWNQLTSIPESIGDLKNLTELYLYSNQLTSIPESIGDLKNLTKLNLSHNPLTSIPESIGDLKNLTELGLSENPLTSIPESIGDLSNLTELYLSGNRLTTIPKSIGDLLKLTGLDLSVNPLTSIPESIGDLKNLTELDLSWNQLTSIPESIGDLKNLTELYLYSNQLTSIPESIGDLKNLTKLNLSHNPLTSIPDSIGDLKNLTELDLYNNMLTSVPSTIWNLRNTLDNVDIRYNDDIVQYGDSEASFGIEQLIEIFGSKLHYTVPRIISITIEEAYKKLMRMPIYWNFDRLKQLRVTPIPQIDMTMDEMMGIWMSLPKEGIDESNTSAMTAFIYHIYKPDEQYNGLSMAREYLQLSKNLLGSVLNILSTKSETDSELVESNINSICEGLKHCNDRKIAELRLTYSILMDQLDNQDETLDGLINNIISNEKEAMFNFTFIRNADHNVHLLNYWKYRLCDEVGFDFDINTGFRTLNQDPFDGHSGNALNAFYSKFTPEHAIEVLTIRINQKENHTHMSELMKTIVNDNELTTEEKESMLVGDIESSMFTGITREGVKYYLLKQGLILQNQE